MTRTLIGLVLLASLAPVARASGLLRPRDEGDPIAARHQEITTVIEDGFELSEWRLTFDGGRDRPFEALGEVPRPKDAVLIGISVETAGLRFASRPVPWRTVGKIRDRVLRDAGGPLRVRAILRNAIRFPVSPVLPGQPVSVTIRWVRRAPLRDGGYEFRFPLDPPAGRKTGAAFDFRVTYRCPVRVEEVLASHQGKKVQRTDGRTVTVRFRGVPARSGEEISIEAVVRVTKPTLVVRTSRRSGEKGLFAAIVTPPTEAPKQVPPRDVIFAIDTSSSMRGRSLTQAKAAARYLLDRLRPVDRVNLVGFADTARAFAKKPVPVTAKNLAGLRRFVKSLKARGGTALSEGLKKALEVDSDGTRIQSLVVLTDGAATRGIRDWRGLSAFGRLAVEKGMRVYTFGIGRAASGSLRALSREGRGEHRQLVDGGEIRSALQAFLDRTATPVLTDLRLVAGGLTDLTPGRLPDVHLGEQLVILGRYESGGTRWLALDSDFGLSPLRIEGRYPFVSEHGGSAIVRWRYLLRRLEMLGFSTGDTRSERENIAFKSGLLGAGTEYLLVLADEPALGNPRSERAIMGLLERAEAARSDLLRTRKLGRPPPVAPEGTYWRRFGRIDVAIGTFPHSVAVRREK